MQTNLQFALLARHGRNPARLPGGTKCVQLDRRWLTTLRLAHQGTHQPQRQIELEVEARQFIGQRVQVI